MRTIMERHASTVGYVSSVGGVMFGLTANDLAALIGAAVGVGMFLVNWYYKAKEDGRREREVTESTGVSNDLEY